MAPASTGNKLKLLAQINRGIDVIHRQERQGQIGNLLKTDGGKRNKSIIKENKKPKEGKKKTMIVVDGEVIQRKRGRPSKNQQLAD